MINISDACRFPDLKNKIKAMEFANKFTDLEKNKNKFIDLLVKE